ncbi:uncharacterized protein LOC119984994 [Tripterygium wilfordii]|uniref:uncharacterized protein LOC119984994 n=1 Tax=Tripterygium wilfordii TaxID=458696 RepID=UPI0018F7E84F|nr:uncharacterized protein LOC119984994 [Tripterygium wilfordii]XP_038685069.1 uncharacterized protein LOC119984994 [Tripterygium wilfordii]
MALLNESDKEDDIIIGAAATKDVNVDTGDAERGDVEMDGSDVELDAAADAELDTGGESDGLCSDYFNSSDPGSYRDSTDEDIELRDDAVRKKSIFSRFKLSSKHTNINVNPICFIF